MDQPGCGRCRSVVEASLAKTSRSEDLPEQGGLCSTSTPCTTGLLVSHDPCASVVVFLDQVGGTDRPTASSIRGLGTGKYCRFFSIGGICPN